MKKLKKIFKILDIRYLILFVSCFLYLVSFFPVHALTTSTDGSTTVSGDYPDPCASGSCSGGGGGGDSTAPAAVTDLNAAATSTSAVTLTWTAPGDDANAGTATSYDIRYSLSSINSVNWESATQIINAPTPLLAGNTQSVSISGLTPNTTYYFALKAIDEGGNQAGLSNVVSARTLAVGEQADTTAPAAVVNLAISQITTSTLTLTWTAPGDDANNGTAAAYDIRYSVSAVITSSTWASAIQAAGEPTPAIAGSSQSFPLAGLAPDTTYYFALKTKDEANNWSALSNAASAKTSAINPVDTTPPVISDLKISERQNLSAKVSWKTDEPATTRAEFGKTAALGSVSWLSGLRNEHELVLGGLQYSQLYWYKVFSRDALNNQASSSLASFGTPPIVTKIKSFNLTETSAKIVVATVSPVPPLLDYGQTTNYELGPLAQPESSSGESGSFGYVYNLNLPGAATYHFRFRSIEPGFEETSADNTFVIKSDMTPPKISGLRISFPPDQEDRVLIKFKTNEPSTAVLIMKFGGLLGFSSPFKTEHEVLGVVPYNGKSYSVGIDVTDVAGNFATYTVLFTPPDRQSPGLILLSQQIFSNSAQLRWQVNDEGGVKTVKVKYGQTETLEIGQLNLAPLSQYYYYYVYPAEFKNLTAGTTYYWRVEAVDEAGNQAVLSGQFTTGRGTGQSQCQDGLDNDGDGKIDYPADPGCQSVDDDDETEAIVLVQCGDGLDNDGDGLIDFPSDSGCASLTDDDETDLVAALAQCGDGLDNDGDGLIDLADPGCVSAADNDESEEKAQPPVPVPPGGGTTDVEYRLWPADFQFSFAKGKIPFVPEQKISALVGSSLLISLDSGKSRKSIESLIVNAGRSSYLFKFDGEKKKWQAEIAAPREPGVYQLDIIANFFDQTNSVTSWQIEALPYGQIFEMKKGRRIIVEGAKVSLLTSPTLWPAGDFGQLNPQVTGLDGAYAFLTPPGRYILKVEKDGYRTEETGYFNSPGAVINQAIELLPLPPSLKEMIKPQASLMENAGNIAQVLGEQATFVSKVAAKGVKKAAKQTARVVKETAANPEVQKATKEVAAPAVATAAAAGTAGAVGLTPLLNYLRFLFTQPALLFRRRRRRDWGVVYNSLTKLPVDLVTVRLVEAATGRVVQTRVTDKAGRYAFFAPVGFYRLEIFHHQFNFPSQFLGALKEDDIYLDLYHGETIEVKEKNTLVTANLPLDPLGAERPIGRLIWQLIWRRFQHTFSLVSLVLALVILWWLPSLLTAGLFVFQIVFYFLFRRLAIPPKRKGWGVIADEEKKRPLKRAIARIFDRQYNKLLETQLSDAHGRYGFLVGRNEYYLTYEKGGYQKKQSESVDLRRHPEPVASVGINVGLKPRLKEDISQPPPPSPEEINRDKEIGDKNYPQKNDFVI